MPLVAIVSRCKNEKDRVASDQHFNAGRWRHTRSTIRSSLLAHLPWITQRQRQLSDLHCSSPGHLLLVTAIDSCPCFAACPITAMSHLHAVVQAVVSNKSPPRSTAYPSGQSSQTHAGGSKGYGSTGSSHANHVYSNYGQQQPYQYGGPSAPRQSLGVNPGDSSGSTSTRESSSQSSPDHFAGERGKEPDIPELDDFQPELDYTYDEEVDELGEEAEYPRLLDGKPARIRSHPPWLTCKQSHGGTCPACTCLCR